jgi:uncharacterized membrane protein
MTASLALHILAPIVWLGGLFVLCVVFPPSARNLDSKTALSLWHKILSRFFVWAWISMALILASGISIVFLRFGGFLAIPRIHRWNMAIGIPAIVLYCYLYFVPWQRSRRAMSRQDGRAAERGVTQARIIMAIILILGLVASAVSAVGRYHA